MGQETTEKNVVIDFLYKDINLINSFYSQLFGGNLTEIQKSELALDQTKGSTNLKIPILNAGISNTHSNNRNITKNINPYDFKIIELLEEFNLKETSIDEADKNSIISISGTLTYRNYNILSKVIPLISKMNIIPDFNNPINTNAKGKNKKFTLGDMMIDFINLLPYGIEFDVQTSLGENATCIINPEQLTISESDLFRSYGSSIPGEWKILGIIDSAESRALNSTNEFKAGIDEAIKAFSETFFSTLGYVIRPITIYRYLNI